MQMRGVLRKTGLTFYYTSFQDGKFPSEGSPDSVLEDL